MSYIKVRNFGPIKSGFAENDGFLDIRKITVFIGNQGTGKSSIAKLISTLSWLEKALYRGEVTDNYVTNYNRFINKYCNYQNLKNYFLPETEIEYKGNAYSISFIGDKLTVLTIDSEKDKYIVPKIMYVPAERNFLSAVRRPEKIKGLSESLYTFWEELERSHQELSGSLTLPVGDVKFEFDKLNKISNLVSSDYKLKLSEASSGFQSFVPLFLVSRNIALSINKEQDTSKNKLSGEEQKRLKTEIEKILSNDNLSDELKEAALEVLSSKYQNECFLNIVEEIEQNLFPTSQKSDGRRCDGMLTYQDCIIFVELKERKGKRSRDWVNDGGERLSNTIDVFKNNHGIKHYKVKIAYIANSKHRGYESETSQRERITTFQNQKGFRLKIKRTIEIKSSESSQFL